MRLLVTGAAGFIASRVARMLLENGHQVVGFDNVNDAYDVRMKHYRLSLLEQAEEFTLVVVDIADRASVESAWAEHGPFDAVFNLAARAGVRQSMIDPWVYITTNVTGTLNLLELCRKHEVRKFILASTSSLYGSRNPLPYSEDADTDAPLSPYAASKKGAEALCHAYHHLYGLDVTIFRYFTVYGPAGRPDMSVFRFVHWVAEGLPVKIYGDGTQSRDFTYVDDIARGTIAGLKPLGFEVINLGNDRPASLSNMLQLVERGTGRSAIIEYYPWHPADVPATWANVAKATSLLGWRPEVSLEEGIASSTDWYLGNREWASRILLD